AALKENEISHALQLGVKMADLGLDPKMVFTDALPLLTGRGEFVGKLELIYEFAASLNQRKIDPSNAIASLYPALEKIGIEDFKTWTLRISNLDSRLLELCLKNIGIILNYFKQHSEANWNRFILALDLYSRGFWGEPMLDEALMAHLCSPFSIQKCVERARDYFKSQARQKAFKLGIKIERLRYEDCIGLIALERKLTEKIEKKTLNLILEKIARYGNCYNYFQAEQPLFYRKFKEETGGLGEKFDAPGVKFSLNYKVSAIKAKMELKSYADKMPISSDLKVVREIIAELRIKHERLYTGLYKRIRDKGISIEKTLEEGVNQGNLRTMIEILLHELQQCEIEGRARYVLLLIEAYAFKETEEIRRKIAAQLDPVLKLNLMAEYWWHNIRTLAREKLIGQKFYDRHIAPLLKEKAEVEKNLEAHIGKASGLGEFRFILSERGISDLSKGDVSQDCLKDRLFLPGIAHVVDPAFLLFKIFDGEEWVGNVYAVVCKDAENKNVLLIDNLSIKTEHPILSGRKEDIDIFAKEFIEQIKHYAQGEKFDYVVIAQDCTPRVRIKNALESLLFKLEKINLRKAAWNSHFSEFEIKTEFIQALGKIEAKEWYEVNCYKI
ncbi:MAG: hypothetical protein QXJ68_08675, partial [Methanocellales archaeon]